MLGLDLARYAREKAEDFVEVATEIHAEIYRDPLFENHPLSDPEIFRQGYLMALGRPRFELLVARLEGRDIGYMYGYALQSEVGWWDDVEWSEKMLASRLDDYTHEDGNRTVVIPEILVKPSWRRRGVGRSMHDEFLSYRSERRAGLLVLPNNFAAKSAYLKWGWNTVGMVRRTPATPLYECMVKPLD